MLALEDHYLHLAPHPAQHAEQVEAILMRNHQVTRAQIDGLWTRLGHKDQKGYSPKATSAANSDLAR